MNNEEVLIIHVYKCGHSVINSISVVYHNKFWNKLQTPSGWDYISATNFNYYAKRNYLITLSNSRTVLMPSIQFIVQVKISVTTFNSLKYLCFRRFENEIVVVPVQMQIHFSKNMKSLLRISQGLITYSWFGFGLNLNE